MNRKAKFLAMLCVPMFLLAACQSSTGGTTTSSDQSSTMPNRFSSFGSQQMGNRPKSIKITAITGMTITGQDRSGATYTVDATNASVMMNNQTSSVSSLAVGDQIMVMGQPSSQNASQIAAQRIFEGTMPFGNGRRRYGMSTQQQTQQNQ